MGLLGPSLQQEPAPQLDLSVASPWSHCTPLGEQRSELVR